MTPRNRFRYRALTPEQELAVKAAHEAGASLPQLAGQYAVTQRTICRTIQRVPRERHVVEIGGFRATFEIEDGVPIQASPWVPA